MVRCCAPIPRPRSGLLEPEPLVVAVLVVVLIVGLAVPICVVRLLFDVRLAALVERLAVPVAIALIRNVVLCRPIISGLVAGAVIGAVVPVERLLRACRGGKQSGQSKRASGDKNPDHHKTLQSTPGVGYAATLAKMRLLESKGEAPTGSGWRVHRAYRLALQKPCLARPQDRAYRARMEGDEYQANWREALRLPIPFRRAASAVYVKPLLPGTIA